MTGGRKTHGQRKDKDRECNDRDSFHKTSLFCGVGGIGLADAGYVVNNYSYGIVEVSLKWYT
jgi:hypothetical protein